MLNRGTPFIRARASLLAMAVCLGAASGASADEGRESGDRAAQAIVAGESIAVPRSVLQPVSTLDGLVCAEIRAAMPESQSPSVKAVVNDVRRARSSRPRWWTRPDPRQWPQVFAYYSTHTLRPAAAGGKHWFE